MLPPCRFLLLILDAILGHMPLVSIFSSCDCRARRDNTTPQTFRILDALHLALIAHCVYFYLVINYANISALTEIVWSAKVSYYFLPEPLLCIMLICFCSFRR